ncbi:hypothetical protein [Sebaldella sp. S0638]|uniref:hypothetical protein n=1 Tax=Sebaldella sp. S0638 TaxID=2957809 RepID=UPI00209DDA78|nr:hypothetical protein [Sebaldella sp. S0638]
MALKGLTRFRTFQAQSITFGNASMEILLNSSTPDQLLNISTAKLTKILKTASKGRLDEDKALFIIDIT